jgi:hypothetical protein
METAAFRDYEFRNGKTDWQATWRTWMRKAKPKGGKVYKATDRLTWRPEMEET